MNMRTLSCAIPAYPAPTLKKSSPPSFTLRSSSQLSVSINHQTDSPFVPEVVEAVELLGSEFRAVDNLVARNTTRVLKAFQRARVGSHNIDMCHNSISSPGLGLEFLSFNLEDIILIQHFAGCTGYGHDEVGGREALDQAFAEIVGAESAIVRSQFFSGTHAITCALFAFLRPGDELLAVAGAPYDTLEEVIGKRDSHGIGSLKDFGVKYREVPLAEDGGLNWDKLSRALKPDTKCAFIQRSRGYSWRRSLSVHEIGRAIEMIKREFLSLQQMQNPNCLVMVDNCYGEFVESIEPPYVGADLIAGSLIKNPGGTIAPCGGYVAGKEVWVKAAAARLSAPGLGVDCGSTPGDIMRSFFQGLFLSPQMVGEAIKGTLLIAEVMASKGYRVEPLPRVPRHDTVQAVELKTRERLLAFCEAVQRSSPIGSFTKPVPGTTPGYASEVIFADGTFIDGSTSELSCDGPLRDPYAVYCQGGTHWIQWGLVLGETRHGDPLGFVLRTCQFALLALSGCPPTFCISCTDAAGCRDHALDQLNVHGTVKMSSLSNMLEARPRDTCHGHTNSRTRRMSHGCVYIKHREETPLTCLIEEKWPRNPSQGLEVKSPLRGASRSRPSRGLKAEASLTVSRPRPHSGVSTSRPLIEGLEAKTFIGRP
ncbi:hypothetical protein TIFTF001_034299 [Ficus carica]|uniref:Aluminum resistance protein n=1 Tax=Ficus carica TaxID=3494 RepID=A0AA88E2I3_FICCA|nr:hypothetical protein TIFTF001_034299 [Ficus carica]